MRLVDAHPPPIARLLLLLLDPSRSSSFLSRHLSRLAATLASWGISAASGSAHPPLSGIYPLEAYLSSSESPGLLCSSTSAPASGASVVRLGCVPAALRAYEELGKARVDRLVRQVESLAPLVVVRFGSAPARSSPLTPHPPPDPHTFRAARRQVSTMLTDASPRLGGLGALQLQMHLKVR